MIFTCGGFFMPKHSHRLIPVVLYGILYLTCFHWLEGLSRSYHVIDFHIDAFIPFCEFFIVPYYLWFFYIAATVLFFSLFNEDRTEYLQLLVNLFFGMSLFLIISYYYPNALDLRPTHFSRDNLFVDLVRILYKVDTPTNVFPSIHVYNSVAACYAIYNCKKLQDHPGIRITSLLLTVFIILSTMLLKQHSVLDVISGILLNLVTCLLIYGIYPKVKFQFKQSHSIINPKL